MAVRIAQARVAPNVGCNKHYLTPGSSGSDLNPVIRTNCRPMCSVKCTEAVWNYRSGRHSAL